MTLLVPFCKAAICCDSGFEITCMLRGVIRDLQRVAFSVYGFI